jgi:hypothetical protein
VRERRASISLPVRLVDQLRTEARGDHRELVADDLFAAMIALKGRQHKRGAEER